MCTRKLVGSSCILLMLQNITAQCTGYTQNAWQIPLNRPSSHPSELVVNCASFSVRSTSPIAPTGVAVHSDKLIIEGPLNVDGELPFLGTVTVEGTLPSFGAGIVDHYCGSGIPVAAITPVAGLLVGTSITPTNLGVGIPARRSCGHIY